MNIVSIIPARGGSKGIPGKNIRLLSGKPLLSYSIEASRKSRHVHRTMVSTDDEETGKIALEHGAEFIRRPAELATDEAPTEPCLIHAIQYLEKQEGYPADIVVLLQATSPLRGSSYIDLCIEKLLKEKADTVFTVCEDLPYFWKKDDDDRFVPLYEKRLRRQDTSPLYRENGAVYATRKNILLENNNRLGGVIKGVVMDAIASLDIDSEFDFWLAEQILDQNIYSIE